MHSKIAYGAVISALLGLSSAIPLPLVARPGNIKDLALTPKNLLSGPFNPGVPDWPGVRGQQPLASAAVKVASVPAVPTVPGAVPPVATTAGVSVGVSVAPSVPVSPPVSTPATPTTPPTSASPPASSAPPASSPPATGPKTGKLPLSFVNNYGGGQVNAYVSGVDPSNKPVMLQADGTFFYPEATTGGTPAPITGNIKIPLQGQGSTTQITLPDYISAARIWFAEGELQFFAVSSDNGVAIVQPSAVNNQDPSANINWGFVELTNTAEVGIYANISYVDFVGFILGMSLQGGDGNEQITKGLQADAVTQICNDLKAQAASDGKPWDKLCVNGQNGQPLRVMSPTDYGSLDPNGFDGYWDAYVDQVWQAFTAAPLNINTQGDAGMVKCQVAGDTLNCDGGDRGFAKPTAADIWGCNSGPFAIQESDSSAHTAIVPRLCAAFNRATLLLGGGDTQPALAADQYYTVEPSNQYSRIVHKYEVDGKGYAFSYDDVNPDGNENASGVVSDPNPQGLTIFVGAPPA